MIYDVEYLKQNQLPKIIIVGSGPAGITLSIKLAEQGIASLILEAGADTYSDTINDTSKGTVVGDNYFKLEQSRLKFFGGSSNHWSGVCRELDDIDFQKREGIDGHIGWPIGKSDLDPYRQGANEILEILPTREATITKSLKEVEFTLSPPVRFGQKYLDIYKRSDKANICFNANLLSVLSNDGRITKAYIADPKQQQISIDIETIVFCTGGIDNSRTLLWSNNNSPQPIVKNENVLGKYWFEHPHNEAGEARIFKNIFKYKFAWGMNFFSPSSEAMIKHGILNASLRLRAPSEPGKNIVRNAFCASKPLETKTTKIFGKETSCLNSIELVWEQEPRISNRIELSETEVDAFGVPRPVLHWKRSELDYRTPKVMMELLGTYLAQKKYGFIRSYDHIIDEGNYPESAWMAGCHHMGGTRMAANEKDGVVDSNLKIFGQANGYILGSSVFPTGGHANPTLTIVQLALRLASHIEKNKQNFT